jgi:acyl-CoA thioesterase I
MLVDGRLVGALVAASIAVACAAPASPSPAVTPSPSPSTGTGLRYVALGDSYTIGTSVAEPERWPDRLVAELATDSPDPGSPRLDLIANLAVNGRTSGDVIRDQLPALEKLQPGFVTLLIGVNDVVQGVPEASYRANLETILDDLTGRLPVDRILVVTTPDYTVTPAGADYGDPASQRAGIVRNNAILTELAGARGIGVVDIFDISGRAATDRLLVASDGLHPSGVQYALWVERIAPVVSRLIGGR